MTGATQSDGRRSRTSCVFGLLLALPFALAPSLARGESSSGKPVLSLLGVRGADDSIKLKDVESYASRLETALRGARNFQAVTPVEIDGNSGGRVARTALLESLRPGDQLEAGTPPGLFGDRVLIVTLEDIGTKHRVKADVYGTSDGTLYLTVLANRDRVTDVVHGLDEKLAPRSARTVDVSDLVKISRSAPRSVTPDWPFTMTVRVEPANRISLSVHVRQDGDPVFVELPPSAVSEDAPGDFTIRLRPTRSGTFSYYLLALRSEPEGTDVIACADGNNEAPNTITVEERDTAIVDLTGMAAASAAPPPPKLNADDTKALDKLRGPRLPPEVIKPAEPHPAIPITAFTTAAVAAAVGAFFTVQTFAAASDRKTCLTVAACEAKTSTLYQNQTIAWSLYGVAAAGVGIGGLAVGLHW